VAQKYVHAVVLAAGLSTRMGGPKAMLPFGGKTVLQTVVGSLLEVDLEGIMVVLGHRADEIRASLAGRPVGVCVNPRFRQGMFSSVLFGISSLPESADAALIVLGDQPHIGAGVVRQVVAAYRDGDCGIVIPTHQGRRGHPALVDVRKYGPEIAGLSGAEGLKPVMRGHPQDTLELPVTDEGILRDIDTPEDYEGELGRLQES
jgi:molybdenum cofactor cytidylyltransferase